jgi:hypothetical protein
LSALVPRRVVASLVIALAAQVGWQAARGGASKSHDELPPAPGAPALRLASFGEPEAVARLAMIFVQSREVVDYARLFVWLEDVLALDPRSQYPLFAAARIYAETADEERARAALEFVYRHFLGDPARRWPWLAHAALLAKHRLKDLGLARKYARALEQHTARVPLPLWARQMEIFILEDMNELEAARIMIASWLQSGQLDDPAELRFLKQRLEELEARIAEKR